MTPRPVKIVACSLVVAVANVAALEIEGYAGNEERHDRFANGYPDAPVPNRSEKFIGSSYDWSGVGWNPHNANQSAALITPLHFITSRHDAFGIGAPMVFQQPDGKLYRATVAGYDDITWIDDGITQLADAVIGRFDKPIPADTGIRPYPLPQSSEKKSHLAVELLVYGHPARIGTARIAGFKTVRHRREGNESTHAAYFTHDPAPGSAQAEAGDSGSPCFIASGDRLLLAGCIYAIHDAEGTQRSYFSLLPLYLDRVRAIARRDRQPLTIVALPPGR